MENCAGASRKFFRFSTTSMKWTTLDDGTDMTTGTIARYGHAVTAIGQDIYLFGGYELQDGLGDA